MIFKTTGSDNPEAEMGFFDHVEALRWHILRSVIAVAVCASVVGIFYDFFFDTIILGICSKDFPTYRLMCAVGEKLNLKDAICIDKDIPLQLQNTALFGQITLLFQYSIIIGFVMAFPYIVYELWRFVAPALSAEQQKKTGRIISGQFGVFLYRSAVLLLYHYSVFGQFCGGLYYQRQNQKQLYD
jgi:sec-independent protein translocase protein TatC